MATEETIPTTEQMEEALTQVCKGLLDGEKYDELMVKQWADRINSRSITALSELGGDLSKGKFKYVVTCMIMQHNGTGLVVQTSGDLDMKKDGYVHVQFPETEDEIEQCNMVTVVTAAKVAI